MKILNKSVINSERILWGVCVRHYGKTKKKKIKRKLKNSISLDEKCAKYKKNLRYLYGGLSVGHVKNV